MPAASSAAALALPLILCVNGQTFEAALADSPAASALVKRAPFEVLMHELNGNEKYANLQSPLPSAAQSVGKIEAGDVMLWGSDCLVVFYQSFRTPYRYTRIAKIADPRGLAEALGAESASVKFSIKAKN